jgi:hypothetical protein
MLLLRRKRCAVACGVPQTTMTMAQRLLSFGVGGTRKPLDVSTAQHLAVGGGKRPVHYQGIPSPVRCASVTKSSMGPVVDIQYSDTRSRLTPSARLSWYMQRCTLGRKRPAKTRRYYRPARLATDCSDGYENNIRNIGVMHQGAARNISHWALG